MGDSTTVTSTAMGILDEGSTVTMTAEVPGIPDDIHNAPTGTDMPTEPEPPTTNSKARVGYRTEYRNSITNELIRDETSETPQTGLTGTGHSQDVVFELVKTLLFIPRGSNIAENQWAVQSVTEPTYSIRLCSPALVNALRAVVQYYPGQDLSGDITIQAPYCILVHHYDDLQKYAKERSDRPVETLCLRDHFVMEHMETLIRFLDENVMEGVRAEMERNARGFYTFAHAWVPNRPGRTMINKYRSRNRWKPGVIKQVSGGTFTTPPTLWSIDYWNLKYDGRYLQRVTGVSSLDPFDGERSFEETCRKFIETEDVEESEDPVVKELVDWGRIYCQLLKPKCMHHSGRNTKVPFQQVGLNQIPSVERKTDVTQIDGLVMADAQTAITVKSPDRVMGSNDLRKGGWRCPCSVCQSTRATDGETDFGALFDSYDAIGSNIWEDDRMTAHQHMLCPPIIRVFVFRTRAWGKTCFRADHMLELDDANSDTERIHVKNLSEPDFDEDMVKNLIIDKKKKLTLTSLAKSFARRNKADEVIPRPLWSADFVEGKGTGLIFLLHGKPGVGKTLTAECIAAFTRRPLMILTASDIGTNPKEVEANLSRHFRLAKSWGAVMLIDEADVFMERRSTADLERNSLVAGFLRALEYYEGILFLTTNRVGSFDDAFISRVHVQLYYPEFTEDQRQQVWKTFMDKLERDRKGYMRLSYAAKEYIRESKKSGLKWNGREIRNAFQTAVSLADYDAEKDEEGTILVTDQHLQAVVELSKDFKDYLKELHMGDEGKRAELRAERLDSYEAVKN
ncbi:ATPAse [Apiospora saccharicola]|uniref:ATPAse n=1 Tax=Apiospora saccharicola TaxID=335842 RepID=A0ABR1VSF6_9PEZI